MAAQHIKIADADATGLERPNRAQTGGIYRGTRNLSRASLERRRTHSRPVSRLSQDRRTERTDFETEEGDDWRNDDGHKKQVYSGTMLLWLSYQSIGAIYGDIGTSPLYVFSSTFSTGPPSHEDVVQVLSIIVWALITVVTLKYVIIILHADNEGEGGTFSTYSLLTRFANLTERDPREEVTVRMQRHLTGDMAPANRTVRNKMEKSFFIRTALKVIGVLAVSMVMSDGILTPAQSVLGAVEGLQVVAPNISNATIVGVSCAILVVLFAVQPLGLSKLASGFAPILIVWLAFNASFGVYNLIKWDHTVLKAFNPFYIFQFFAQKKTEGWKMLGGILLAFTGVEALFADLGAFSMRAIQLSWLCWVFPCLLLSYSGQAAYLASNPTMISNPFYFSVPPGMLYPTLVVAILAAIIASQAIITATFQLINQIMKLSYCPQVKVVHTSKTFHGQLYVPFLNWVLLCGTILVTAVYNNTTSLGNAYGVCVMFVTFFDTCMVSLVAILVWRFPLWVVALPFLFFALIDGLFLSSALLKVPDGAWFTLTIASILAFIFLLWRFGKEAQWAAEAEDRIKTHDLVVADGEGRLHLTPKFGGDLLAPTRGFGIFFDKTGVLTPAVFVNFVTKFSAVPDVMVFFHLHPVDVPSVPDDQRFSVTRFTSIPGCYRLVVKHGFMDEVVSPDLSALIYERVRMFVIRQAALKQAREGKGHGPDDDDDGPEKYLATDSEGMTGVKEVQQGETEDESDSSGTGLGLSGLGLTPSAAAGRTAEASPQPTAPTTPNPASAMATGVGSTTISIFTPSLRPPTTVPPTPVLELRDQHVAAELARLDRAFAAKAVYLVGKEQMRLRKTTPLPRRVLLSVFLWIRDNTRAKVANLRLAMEKVVEVGFVKDI